LRLSGHIRISLLEAIDDLLNNSNWGLDHIAPMALNRGMQANGTGQMDHSTMSVTIFQSGSIHSFLIEDGGRIDNSSHNCLKPHKDCLCSAN
jgi:hypothetical protein